MSNFERKTTVITGAGSGIGRATALAFAAKGANVVVADIDENGGAETVSLIEKMEGNAIFCATNVASQSAVENLFQTALKHYSSVDFAINNAGIGGPYAPTTQ